MAEHERDLHRLLTSDFRSARRSERWAVIEGFHAVKHALRFGAKLKHLVTDDLQRLLAFADELAPDVREELLHQHTLVPTELLSSLMPRRPPTGVAAIGERTVVDASELLSTVRDSPLVLLERPSDLGNIGAVVRVAAAAGASGVLTTGTHDPWAPASLRGSTGLHYAIPVGRTQIEEVREGPLVAVDPGGTELSPGLVPAGAVIAFGSERRGLSDELLSRADLRVGIPMRAGVSSLNLAAAVALLLYGWRFGEA